MYIRPRIIPTLLIDDGKLVKTKRFKKPQYLGDPINAIKIFNEKGVDEVCILDISASRKGKKPDMKLLEDMASEAFMPLSYGGGITGIEEIKDILYIGFEKIILNTSAAFNPQLVNDASRYFGSQSVVVSIDYKNSLLKKSICFCMDGSKIIKGKNPIELAKDAERLGAGEVLLYSIDRDGMREGYDLEMIKEVSSCLKIPVIACGGADSPKDMKMALDVGADALAAGSMFVYFGNRQAILINFPEENIWVDEGIFSKE